MPASFRLPAASVKLRTAAIAGFSALLESSRP
jgi:hypothetical protein